MAVIVVGVGEGKVSRAAGDVIKAAALGSSVAVIMVAPPVPAAGLLLVALPDSALGLAQGARQPGLFADTGVPYLLRLMEKVGGSLSRDELVVKLAGGADVMGSGSAFFIGRRNLLAVRKALSVAGLEPTAEDVGDIISRTVSVEVSSGRVVISSPGRGQWDL